MKIYNIGSLNIDYVYGVDHFVAAGETLSADNMTIFPGGKGLNQSVALAKAGVKVVHGAVVGDNGEFLIHTLRSAGVDVSRIKKVGGSCGHAIIQVDKKGENCILLFPGTNHCIEKGHIEEVLADAEKGDILLLQNEINGLDMIFEVAHQKQMQIAFNPSPFSENIYSLQLSYVNWWFCNEIEGAALFGSGEPKEIANNFVKQFPHSSLILTLGKDGSVFVNADTYIEQPIYNVHAVDTTAAGDTFTGYFIAALSKGCDIACSLDIASKAAAIAVSRQGASTSIPFIDEVCFEQNHCVLT